MSNTIVVSRSVCNACGVCVQTCPQLVYEQKPGECPEVAHPERCFGCLACEEDCAHGGITVHRLPDGMSVGQIPAPGTGLDGDRVYDMVVVGAGPAGLAAAMRARRLGLSVAVLDRLPSSRRSHHPDGGLLFASPDTTAVADRPDGMHLDRFDITIPAAMVRDRLRDFVFMGPDGLATRTSRGRPVFPYVFKDDLIGLIVDRTLELGTTIAWNTRVQAIRRDRNSGLMSVSYDDDRRVQGRVVISAEGSTGRLAERAGIPVNAQKTGWAYAAMAQFDPQPRPSGELGFLVGPIAGSPVDVPFLSFWATGHDHTELAAGPLQLRKTRVLEEPLENYLARLAEWDARVVARVGGPIDLQARRRFDGCRVFARRLPQTAVGDGVLAVGDAIATCGMCTTLAAMRTGDMAAEVAAGALARGDTSVEPLKEFDRRVFELTMIQGMKWMHNLLIEAPLRLKEPDLRALFEMLQHLNLTRLMSGSAMLALVPFYLRNLIPMASRRDLRRYLIP